MKIYVIALAVFVFSNMVSIYNDLGIFGEKAYEPGLHNISESEVNDIFLVESGGNVKTSSSWIDDITGGLGFLAKLMDMVCKMLINAVNLGGVFSEYVPGVVGELIGGLITAVTYFVYAWGGIQLWQKVSTKNMD